jgi:acyl-CoA synthetase (AMP-forming)/AMP-acid ligase II
MPSHLWGPEALAVRFPTLSAALEARAGRAGLWLSFHKGRETPDTLDGAGALELAKRWAASLFEAGVRAGDRVGVLQPNGRDFVGAFFGALRLGASAVPLPWPVMEGAPERTRDDVKAVVERAKLSALATTPAMAGTVWPVPVVTAPSAQVHPAPALDAVGGAAFIQFTSGSTGAPRGAVLSHGAALASATAMGHQLGLGPGEVGVSWIPFFHDMGLVGVLLCSLVTDFEVHVLRPAEFLMRPSRWFELCSRVGATLTVGPNFGYELLVRRGGGPQGLELQRLRRALNGSEPIHRTTVDALAQTFAPAGYAPAAMTPVYGLAEATLGVCFARAPAADLVWQGRQVVSVGQPLPGVEVRLVRDGVVVPEGSEGEICVKGPMLMSGYFDDAEATRAALRDGWLHTGDLGVMAQGALHVTGREKELIIKAGQKFHPYDIERVVAETVDTTPNGVAAFSRPDEAAGSEALVVVVELRRVGGSAEAGVASRAKLMEKLGVRADVVELVAAGELPRTTSGKVKRRECAQRFGGRP